MPSRNLRSLIQQVQLSGYAPGAWKNFCSVLQKYYTFCRQYGLTALPASTDSLNRFAVITALRVKSPHTVSNYISALKSIHHVPDFPLDSFSDFSLRLTLWGLYRSMIYVSQWKRPITIQMLYQFAKILLPGGHTNNICLLACILVGFFSFFRSSNLLPKSTSKSDFSPLRQLSRGSFSSMTGGSYSPFFIPKVISSPRSYSAFQFHEYRTLLFAQSQLCNAISKLFLKGHQTVLPS